MLQIHHQVISNLKLRDSIETLLQMIKSKGNKIIRKSRPWLIQEEYRNMSEIWKDGSSWKTNKQEKPNILMHERTSIKLEMQIREVQRSIYWIWIMKIREKENSWNKKIMIKMSESCLEVRMLILWVTTNTI